MVRRRFSHLGLVLLGCVLPLVSCSSCQPDNDPLLPPEEQAPPSGNLTLVARLVQITDTQIVDEQSPARFAGAHDLVPVAWRAWESSSTQVVDGIVRMTNRIHASGRLVDFVVNTGDCCDNAQGNELRWCTTLMDGGSIDPLTGPDDRDPGTIPVPTLDPHAPFVAQGLYQHGVHGDLPSIPWYALMGNHDTFCIGVFPITESAADGHLISVLPLPLRLGLLLPTILDPIGDTAYGPVSPAHPGPPPFASPPVQIQANPERAFFRPRQFMDAMWATRTGPAGHGFAATGSRPWYSVSPLPGVRLIGLFSSDQPHPIAEFPNDRGCIDGQQYAWLKYELDASTARGELIIVASHHPSGSLETLYGSAADPVGFRALLNAHPAVVLHIAGHNHRNRVAERGNYLEIETTSTMDAPQEARIIEIWRDADDGSISVSYDTFSHVHESWPPLGSDPLEQLREQAWEQATQDNAVYPATERSMSPDERAGTDYDRHGMIRLPRTDAAE